MLLCRAGFPFREQATQGEGNRAPCVGRRNHVVNKKLPGGKVWGGKFFPVLRRQFARPLCPVIRFCQFLAVENVDGSFRTNYSEQLGGNLARWPSQQDGERVLGIWSQRRDSNS